MLTGLTIGNFKAFGEPQHIPIRPLTLIFGANSSGKSSVLHALLFLNYVATGGAVDARRIWRDEDLVDLGGFGNYVHRHDPARVVNLAADLGSASLTSVREWEMLDDQDTPLRVQISIGGRDGGGQPEQIRGGAELLRVRFSDETYPGAGLTALRDTTSRSSLPGQVTSSQLALGQLLRMYEASSAVDPDTWRFIGSNRGVLELDDSMVRNRHFLRVFNEGLLPGLDYLGPLRSYPSRELVTRESGNPSFSASGESAWHRVQCDGQARARANETLTRLGLHYQLDIREWRSVSQPAQSFNKVVLLDARGLRLNRKDVGTGISQVLPVVVSSAAGWRSLLAIEQPELHLHPALQAELGDVFIESALGERGNTFLLETHSEHLILRILRRVRETTEGTLPEGKTPVRPEDVSVVYVQPGPNGSEVLEMPVTPDGDFGRPWPGGFFAERAAELF
jgi:hypothetical protein